MIDVHDLCIGNWVYDGDKTQFPMFIRAIGEDYVYLDFEGNEGDLWESTPDDLYGIPLTAELLEKCGYKRTGEMDFEHQEHYFDIDYRPDSNEYHWWYNFEYMIGKPIYFLHELQNQFRNYTKQQLKVQL